MSDYNAIKWEDYFYLDETSPSGLRWKISCMTGAGYRVSRMSAGDTAGNINSAAGYKMWIVTLHKKRYRIHRIIYCLLYGKIDNKLVIDHLDGNSLNNKHKNLSLKTQKANMQNVKMHNTNKSGHTGVVFVASTNKYGDIHNYWAAHWQNLGKTKQKHFSIEKLGDNEAKRLAIEYRKQKIEELNMQGADYTTRHGVATQNNKS